MLKSKYAALVQQIYNAVDDQIEIDTSEGQAVFQALMRTLFYFHPDVKCLSREVEFQ